MSWIDSCCPTDESDDVPGDWWGFGGQRYGERAVLVRSDDWDGPSFQTCMNAAAVCRAFETSRRREVLSFAHHAEVAGLPPAQADEVLDCAEETIPLLGRPRPKREIRSLVHQIRNAVGTVPSGETCEVSDLHELVRQGRRFGCLYADPPWLYANQGTRAATGNHYGGMSVDELCALPVGELAADDAHLHLWVTNAFKRDAFTIFDAWDFEFRSELIWDKGRIGLGNYWRAAHECLWTAVRGDATRFRDHSMPSIVSADRGVHSAKPEEVRAMIERASDGPYLELFARTSAPGWTVWGNEVPRALLAAE